MKERAKKRLALHIGLGLLLAVLIAGLWMLWINNRAMLLTDAVIDQAYMVKQADDTALYVIDSSHNRVLHLTTDGEFLWCADMPMGLTGAALYADDVAFAADGTTWVAVSDWDGMHIDREMILVYDKHGRLVNTINEAAYTCGAVNKHSRFGMSMASGQVSYLQADEDGLTLTHANGSISQTIAYPGAATRVADACILDDCILVLDKNGTIFRIAGEERTICYSAALDQAANRMPYRMTVDAAGRAVFSDIRNRSVQRVTDDPGVTETLWTDTDAQTVCIGVDGQLMLAEPNHILMCGSGDTLSTWTWGGSVIAMRIAGLVMAVATAALAIYFLVRLIRLLSKLRLSNAQRTSLLLMFCVMIAVALVCIKLIDGFSLTYRDKIREELSVTAYMVAGMVDGDDIANVNTAADFDSESYHRLVDEMQWAFSADVALYSQLYCNILRADDKGNAWAIAYYDQSIGTYFPLDESAIEETFRVIHTGHATWTESSSLVSGVFCYVKVPVFNDDDRVVGVIEVGTETNVLDHIIANISRQLLMTLLVLILLIWLAVGELMAYSGAEERYRRRKARAEKQAVILPGHLIRLLVFVVFTAYNMTASFLPVYILRSVEGLNVADRELMASLPITLNIFFIGTMALCCAGLLRKMSIRTLTMFSALFSVAGNLLMFLAPTYPCILAGLILDGIGMGLVSNAVYVLITRIREEKERLSGFAIYNAACISGINFGMMLGSILADNFNQHMVFACVAALWLVVIGVMAAVDKHTGDMLSAEEKIGEQGGLSLGCFLRSKGVLAFMVLIQNPYIIFNSFVYYFVPLFCDELGLSETTVSLLLMVNSLFAVYLSDTITSLVDRLVGRRAMYLALGLNICAVVLFAQKQTMPMLIAALVLMGLSASFGKSVQQIYYMELPAARGYGEDRAIGLYNFSENIGESLGPVVFGKLAVFSPRSLGFAGLGGITAVLGALHIVLSRFQIKKK